MICNRCNKDKPKEQFHRSATRTTGRQAECKTCRRSIDRLKRNKLSLVDLKVGDQVSIHPESKEYDPLGRIEQVREGYICFNREWVPYDTVGEKIVVIRNREHLEHNGKAYLIHKMGLVNGEWYSFSKLVYYPSPEELKELMKQTQSGMQRTRDEERIKNGFFWERQIYNPSKSGEQEPVFDDFDDGEFDG